jgi:hypothetical protein
MFLLVISERSSDRSGQVLVEDPTDLGARDGGAEHLPPGFERCLRDGCPAAYTKDLLLCVFDGAAELTEVLFG